MVNMDWHKKAISEHKKEIISSALFAVILALAILLWHFALGQSFQWKEIDPISQPSLLFRSFYSALAFLTLGAFLYWIRFYKLLHFIFVEVLGDWQSYKAIKGIIWVGLILAIYYIVQKVIALLNTTISFFYNILSFVLYLVPPLGASIIAFAIGYVLFKRAKLEKSR